MIGGGQVPVVITRFPEEPLKGQTTVIEPDYVFVSDQELINDLPEDRRYILTV